jgi:hypothetical protein
MALTCPNYAGPIYRWTKENMLLYNMFSFLFVMFFLVMYVLFKQNIFIGIFLIIIIAVPMILLLLEQVKYNVGYVGGMGTPLKRCFPRNKKTESSWLFWMIMQVVALLIVVGIIGFLFFV